jgi:3-hydroxyisobutyrate dehydrogenase-like beta-hydroxyacid dehydrogenase
MNIGFIGTGIMGGRMAANLQKAGHALIVHNRTRAKAEGLLAAGARWADSPAALATEAEIIFTMLAPTQAVANAATGEDGFLSKFAPGGLWVDCSTVNPTFSQEMAEAARTHGIRFVDAPVTGSKSAAALATLAFWVGGAATDVEACRPLLKSMGNQIVHCGGVGTGSSLKIVINQLLGTGMAAFAEALVLGESLGLPRSLLLEAMLGGAAAAPFLKSKQERIEHRNYEPADFPLRWLQKDLYLAIATAQETGAAMPMTSAAKEIYRLAIRAGHGSEDFSAIYDYLAQQRGH